MFVGNGTPAFARAFREDQGIEAPVYVDPSRATYRALGMKRSGLASLFTVRVLANARRALRAGFRQGRTRGDAWQLGGVLVVRPGGEVALRHLSSEQGDHPPVEEIVRAV